MTCPDPATCPVDQTLPTHPRTTVIGHDDAWYNVSRHRGVFNGSGRGDGRFNPMSDEDGRLIPHAYLAQNPVGALLESALHDTWGDERSVQRSDLEGLMLRAVVCRSDIHVLDLRDRQLVSYGMAREQIVASPSEHYACTRRWARPRSETNIDGRLSSGFMWNSRQAEIAAQHADTPLRVLLTVAEQTGHVAVVYDHADIGDALFDSQVIYPDLSRGDGLVFVRETATATGLFVEG